VYRRDGALYAADRLLSGKHPTQEQVAATTTTIKQINDNRYYWQCRDGDSVKSEYKGLVNPDE
jgi:hypothetical protein